MGLRNLHKSLRDPIGEQKGEKVETNPKFSSKQQEMMKHTQTIFGKYWRRVYSSIASSPLSSTVKQGWAEQNGLGLFGAFYGGWCIHASINVYHRRKHWYKVDRLSKENDKRFDEVIDKTFQRIKERQEASRKGLLARKNRFNSD